MKTIAGLLATRTGAVVILLCGVVSLLSCGTILYESAKYAERSKAGLSEHRVVVADHTVVYLEGGSGEEVLLLIHGFGGDKDNWTRMARHLGDDFRIIAPDLPGFGESDRLERENYGIQQQADRLAEFIQVLDIEGFHLAGNSMGGWIACWYVLRHPGQARSLILLNSAGVISPVKSEHLLNLERGYNTLLVDDVDDYDRLIEFVFADPPYIPRPLKRRFAEEASAQRPFNEKIWADIMSEGAFLESRLAEIDVPAFIIWGDSDRVLHPSSVEVFTSGIAGAGSLIMKNCGHLPMIERPGETAEAVADFTRRLK